MRLVRFPLAAPARVGAGYFNPDQVSAVLPTRKPDHALIAIAGTDQVIEVVGAPADVAVSLCMNH